MGIDQQVMKNTMASSMISWNGYFYDIPWYFYLLANEIEIPSVYD